MNNSPRRLPNGNFQFSFDVKSGLEFEVQASPDLKDWATLAKGVSTGKTIDSVDSNAPQFASRFYRLISAGIVSSNIVGHVSITLPPGFSMIANPFNSANNTVGELFRQWPNGTMLNKFDSASFRLGENSIQFGKWTDPEETLAPGEGAIFFNPTWDNKSHSFVGEVMQGRLSLPLPAGFSIRSSMVPQQGRLHEDLGLPISQGDVIHRFDRESQKYILYPFGSHGWEAGEPVVTAGESFWIAKTSPENWTQEFSIGV